MQFEEQQIGHYRLLHFLGNGGMGTVYLAADMFVNRQVAIKVIRSETAIYPDDDAANEAVNLFRREANAIAMLDHPNILPLFDYGEENLNGTILTYMVMPYRQEGSLTDWLHRVGNPRPFTPQAVMFIIHQAASALQFAHDHHIIHRDVKPSNFLIRMRPENPAQPDLLLADFGIAKFTTAISSADTMTRGTPTYMPPEQWEDHPVFATDQYALGVMMYELLTGRLPFQGNHSQLMYQHFHIQPSPLSSINPRLSPGIDTVILRALAKNPNDRFPTIATFGQAFQQAVGSSNAIHVTLTISHLEAINGTRRTITLPDSRIVTVSVPAGAYDGQIIQVEDHEQVERLGDSASSLIITVVISRIEGTIESSRDSRTIEDTLPMLSINHNEMPNNNHRSLSTAKIMLLALVLMFIAGSVALFIVNHNGRTRAQTIAMETALVHSSFVASTATSIAQTTATDQTNATATAQAQINATIAAQANATATARANATATTQAQIDATATVQAQVNATATAQAQQTASVVAGMTATAEAQASETPGVLQTAISVQPMYQDALNDATSANTVSESWEQSTNCIFALDGYHEKEKSNWHICAEGANIYQNMAITVNVQILNGISGGLMFRVRKDLFGQYSGYLFEVNNSGQYRIAFISQQLTSLSFTYFRNWMTSSALLKGNSAVNKLEVIANGVTLDFYINGTFIDQEVDSSNLSGDIAFYATTDGATEADVVYNDLNIYPMS